MVLTAPALIEAPPVVPALGGLLGVADVQDAAAGSHVEMGVSYFSYLCGTVGAFPAWCGTAPGINYDAVKAFTGGQATTGWPFVIYSGVECDLFGRDEYGPAARARLAGGEDAAVAKAFLGQQFFGVGPTPVDVAKPITDADTALLALAALEQYAGSHYAGQPVLHMNRATATLLSKFGVLAPDINGTLVTTQGTLVANSAGYPDNFIFVTGAVHVWRTAVTELSVDNPMKNTAMGLAERTYVVTTDCLLAYAGTKPTPIPAPTLTTVAPTSGPVAGGTTLTLTGTGYTPGEITDVLIGGLSAPFTITDATHLNVTTPASGPGTFDVVVVGTSGSAVKANGFTFNPPPVAPTITTVNPGTGLYSGATNVTLTGKGFTGATGVTFGGTPGTSFVVVSDTSITVRTPAHAAGIVDVVVAHPLGNATKTGAYLYTDQPLVNSVAPNTGSIAGGTAVTLTGLRLTNVNRVRFGVTDATNVVVVNATTVTCTTPAHASGLVGVSVFTPTDTFTNDLYTYV